MHEPKIFLNTGTKHRRRIIDISVAKNIKINVSKGSFYNRGGKKELYVFLVFIFPKILLGIIQ